MFCHVVQVKSQNVYLATGSKLTVKGSGEIVIKNGGFVNNGAYFKGLETVSFTGSLPATLSGVSNTVFNNVKMATSGGITTTLELLTAYNVTIMPGSKLCIEPNKSVTVNGDLTNNSGTAGGLLLKSTAEGTASLLHNTTNVPATIQRYVTGSKTLTAMMYHMVSIPLIPSSSSTSNLFQPSFLFDFAVNTNGWRSIASATSLDETRGYMTYYASGTSTTYLFSGLMNNGAFTPLTTYTTDYGFNLVPNPYPSAIDWNASSGWEKKENIGGSIYFWPGGIANSSNYASWNGSIGINGGTPYIPVGQSFFVQATSEAPVLRMNNSVRVHNAQSFWKSTTAFTNVLRLATVANEATDELVIHFREGATKGFDSEYDAFKLQGGANAPQISSIDNDGNSLSINSLPLVIGTTIVPLKFSFSSGTGIVFKVKGIESFEKNIPILLEDLALKKVIDLRLNPEYSFTYETGKSINRFQLRFSVTTGLQTENHIAEGTAFISNGYLYMKIPDMDNQKAEITISNTLGQQLLKIRQVLSGITQIPLPNSANGVLIVRVNSGKKLFTAKILNNH